MELTNARRQIIKAIDCERIKAVVVVTDESGEQVQNPRTHDWVFPSKAFPGAPENCPLTSDPTLRQLSDFAVCNSCVYSIVATHE